MATNRQALTDAIDAIIEERFAPLEQRVKALEGAPKPPPAPAPAPPPPSPAPVPVPAPPPPQAGIRSISGQPGTPIPGIDNSRWGDCVRHQYSKISAWNADQSLLRLLNRGGTPESIFVDGRTFAPVAIKQLGCTEFRWHPTQANLAICTAGNQIFTWDVRSGAQTILATFSQYGQVLIGPWEGNPSDDGEWIALAGDNRDCFAFNLGTKQALPPVSHNSAQLDFTTVSASGKYLLVVDQSKDVTKVFDRATGANIATWEPSRPSHYDLTLDEAGEDVAIGVWKKGGGLSNSEDGRVISRRLKDGAVSQLTRDGYASHTSARNVKARGRVFCSFANDPNWQYRGQIVMVGRVAPQAIAAHGSNEKADYWAESQPCPSPDGKMVIFASNKEGPIKAYIVTL